MSDLCLPRQLAETGLDLPLMVPSFSSKGFPGLGDLALALADEITDYALISLYDVAYGHISGKTLTPNLLFLDSGGYEAGYDCGCSEICRLPHSPSPWSSERHRAALRDFDSPSVRAVVSYDDVTSRPTLCEQLRAAEELFSECIEPISVLLLKASESEFLDTDAIIKLGADALRPYDVVGFTEKELGTCLAERVRAIGKIRLFLTEAGLNIPIHIFGCLDPYSVTRLFLAGADIFDGLSWLRYGFLDGTAVYTNNWACLNGYANLPAHQMIFEMWKSNLAELRRLQTRLLQCARQVLDSSTGQLAEAKREVSRFLESA